MCWGHKGNEPNQFVGECDHLSVLPFVTEHLPEVDASGRQHTAVGSEVLAVNDKHHIRVETIVKHPGRRQSHSAKGATLRTSRLHAGPNICLSHVFGGHMGVNCSASLQTLNVSDDLKWTTNTRVTPFTLTFKA